MQYAYSLLLACALTLIFPLPAFSNNQENLNLLRERIQLLQKDLANKESLRQDTTNALREAEQAIKDISRKITKLLADDQQAVEEYKQLQTRYQLINKEIEAEQNRLEKLLYQQYIGRQQNSLHLLLDQHNPNQIARDAHYYKQFALARSNSITNLKKNQYEILALTESSRHKKEQITAIQTEYYNERKKLEQEKNKQKNILSRVSENITLKQQELNKLKNDEKRITRLVNEINKFLIQEKSGNNTQINNKLPDTSTANIPFPSLKGKLNLPVRGKLVHTFGGQRSGKHITWKGLFIQAPKGSDVKAISGGRVVFADWLRGFGNLIILDHGNNYLSLYGNNTTLHKQVGDLIRGGDTIAIVGNSGGNADSGLYFELRHKGKPFDPLMWIKIE
ncbi:murein hydrolase activator EnvC family protein [Nitrosomonas supralitoralis]|uniref:Peptidase M23 n=1 Tax=Nitrosomonas supralitoralis TaxID=2116706 RepID=A0A2P7NZ82_9PROT|nr:peptidoglycan DD-metalloendopeptidase family protein [Nitrosomonas supralitoralis]PSJ18766.1 peptidase M23 [Nitrosomonas supralitoralis]